MVKALLFSTLALGRPWKIYLTHVLFLIWQYNQDGKKTSMCVHLCVCLNCGRAHFFLPTSLRNYSNSNEVPAMRDAKTTVPSFFTTNGWQQQNLRLLFISKKTRLKTSYISLSSTVRVLFYLCVHLILNNFWNIFLNQMFLWPFNIYWHILSLLFYTKNFRISLKKTSSF